jgi:catechol 2,3-dioxygenase-like lactoylglutathione lyase family enzyme
MKNEAQPTIVAPVMRFVPVAELARSLNFYRDVLGFGERECDDEYGAGASAELELGDARLQLCQREQPDKHVFFFQTDDVELLRDSILNRGGSPSGLERVNWIKMEVFEIRDPDGHTLWFGKSFDQPDGERPEPMLWQALPHLPVDDVAAAITYYEEVLGFSINYAQDDLGVMYRDKVTLLLIDRTEAHSGIGSFTAYIKNADSLHDEFAGKGAEIEAPPVSRPWGLRDFTVIDPCGNRLTFAQPFE